MKKLIISTLLLCITSCEKESEDEQFLIEPIQSTQPTQLDGTNSLCGIWYGLGYQCNGSIPVEIIHIEHVNDFVRATKITGDNCVEAGQITWQGYYYQSPFIANLTLGSSINPQSTITQDLIYIQNDSTITTQIGLEFIKLSLVEIEALNLNIDIEGICKPQN
jgi:hypothetical protein